jgi:hypothetical protein
LIYEFPRQDSAIRQGDIFMGLPRIEVSLERLPVLETDGSTVECEWRDIAKRNSEVVAILPLRPVSAIVASQDCDAANAPDVTLCEIRPFVQVERKSSQTTSAKSWKNLLTQHARLNLKWFYLPPDPNVGFDQKMAVDFLTTLRVPRLDLERLRDFRKGRLNGIAEEHFRERISEFFRRYAYDEWYPLNREELESYKAEYPDSEPFPWQV